MKSKPPVHVVSPCRACGKREAKPGLCGPCGEEAQEQYEGLVRDQLALRVAEARAAYWKLSSEHTRTFVAGNSLRLADLERRSALARAVDEARERLRALGAEP